MHPKVARALRAARRPYADGGDVVRERATILPLGTYEDGTTRAAWPGVIYEPAAAAKRLVDYFMGGNYRPGDDEATRQLAEDSFTAASAVPVAGLAAAAVRPGVSLGSGGGRLQKVASMMDPEEANLLLKSMDGDYRRYRANLQGYDTNKPLYHLTNKSFDEFKVGTQPDSHSGNGAVWFRRDPRANVSHHNVRVDDEGAREIPIFARLENEVPTSKYEELGLNRNFPVVVTPQEGEFLKSLGYTHATTPNGNEYAVFDPRNIRSVNAAFDPDQIDSANILAANSSKAATPGLAALESNRVRGSSLPMDEASRMARAREMGFDPNTKWYHGTNEPDLQELKPGLRDPGIWMTTDLMNASNYARGLDANVHYLRAKPRRSFVVESADEVKFVPSHEGELLPFDNNVDIVKHAFANGYDSVHFPWGNFSESGDTLVVRQGNQVRDVAAAFDPAKATSTNLLAANPSTASILSLLPDDNQEKRKAPRVRGTSRPVQ